MTSPEGTPAAAAVPVHHLSSSHEQISAEAVILAVLSEHLGVAVGPADVALAGGGEVHVDGVSTEPPIFVEVFAHQGRLKGGQNHKVSTDAFKLVTLGREHPDARLILAFADPLAAQALQGNGWKASALRTWGIEIFVADLDRELRDNLVAAQTRQRMVNAVEQPQDPDVAVLEAGQEAIAGSEPDTTGSGELNLAE